MQKYSKGGAGLMVRQMQAKLRMGMCMDMCSVLPCACCQS